MRLALQSDPQNRGTPTMPLAAKDRTQAESSARPMISLLPGPVALRPEVVAAFAEPILYHRSTQFLELYERTRKRLAALVGEVPVAILVGSGTLANEAVAATLAADPASQNGLVLISGEFGMRLHRQAKRWRLQPRVLSWNWGEAWDLNQIEDTLREMPAGGWIWGVHHETSTGVCNDANALATLARKYGQRVCLDAVSSLGTKDINLSDIYLTTGTSGKALGGYPGLAFVFAQPENIKHLSCDAIPAYLDVLASLAAEGPRFTVPSPLIRALDVALEPFSNPATRSARFQELTSLACHLRDRLNQSGIVPIAHSSVANPAIVTFAPPGGMSTATFIEQCERLGYWIAGQSEYLAERQLVQISLMGNITRCDVDPLLDALMSRPYDKN